MTERDMKTDLIFALAIALLLTATVMGKLLQGARSDRDAWKRTAAYWEGSWHRWAAQMDTLPPHGVAKADRGE